MKVKISGFYDEASGKLDKQLALIKKLGEKYICPRSVDGKNIAEFTADEFIRDIKPKLDNAGVLVSSLGSPIGKVGIDDEEGFARQKLQLAQLIKIAQAVNCRYIRIFSFFYGEADPSQCRDKVISRLKEFLEIAAGSGVKLMHENEKKVYGDTPERVMELYNALKGENFALCFDASNYVQCGIDPASAFDTLQPYTDYYHIKDCSKYNVEVPVGTGKGCYEYILARLAQSGYEGFMTMEPHTLKYAILKPFVCFVPFMPLIMRDFYRAFRLIDKAMGVSFFKCVSRERVFIWQHERLKKMLEAASNSQNA